MKELLLPRSPGQPETHLDDLDLAFLSAGIIGTEPPPYILKKKKSTHFVEWNGNADQISNDTVVSWPVAVLNTTKLDKRTQAQDAPSSRVSESPGLC